MMVSNTFTILVMVDNNRNVIIDGCDNCKEGSQGSRTYTLDVKGDAHEQGDSLGLASVAHFYIKAPVNPVVY